MLALHRLTIAAAWLRNNLQFLSLLWLDSVDGGGGVVVLSYF